MTISQLAGDNAYTDNYSLKTSSLEYTAQVKPIAVEFKSEKIITKDYDGNNQAIIQDSDYSLSPIVNGESLLLELESATYDNFKAGSGKVVTATVKGLKANNDQTSTDNYSFDKLIVTFDGRIVGKPLTIEPKVGTITKTYDGTTTATITTNNYSLTGDIPAGSALSMKAIANYRQKMHGIQRLL